ncbi:MAG TPA: ribokinase [Candidatus Limnocylindria bacterium]|nr:ribokinase [Candidatus Limnocylindria bacterium]
MRGEVLVVGSINVDLVIRAAQLPAPGQSVSGGVFAQHQGGKGANQAVAAARRGASVTMVGAVGDDEYGQSALADMRREGVDVSRVAVMRGESTGLALIAVDERGANQIVVAPGANYAFGAAAIEQALAGYKPPAGSIAVLSFELGDEAVVAAAAYAASRGMQLLVNPAPARVLPRALVALSPIVLPNEGEAATLTGLSDPGAAALALAAQTRAPVIVTLGVEGALLCEPGARQESEILAAPKVDVVDTTGAGDAFVGALAANLAAGKPLREAAAAAVEAASQSVTTAGAR